MYLCILIDCDCDFVLWIAITSRCCSCDVSTKVCSDYDASAKSDSEPDDTEIVNRVIRAKQIDPNDPMYDPEVAAQHAKEPVHGKRAETSVCYCDCDL